MFRRLTEKLFDELEDRKNARNDLRRFGVSFLDDALIGIRPGDLVLIGAPPGVGKTGLCCNIALANIDDGRKVHMIALEADEFEIERRIKYQIFSRLYYREGFSQPLSFDSWIMGDYIETTSSLEIKAIEEMQKFKELWVHYKTDKFGVQELVERVVIAADKSDLFIIDHAHYFDLEDDNENRALKHLAKTVRQLSIDESKPIILVAHLRKRDKGNPDLAPGLDEFHGTSDLAKIATRVITMTAGSMTDNGLFETFFRIPKNRLSGSSSRYIARVMYNPQKGTYENQYRLGSPYSDRATGFEEIPVEVAPRWARNMATTPMGGGSRRVVETERWHDKY